MGQIGIHLTSCVPRHIIPADGGANGNGSYSVRGVFMGSPAIMLLKVKPTELDWKLEKCRSCGRNLQESLTGKRKGPKGLSCSKCYFESLGDLAESSPIGVPHCRVS
jgi:hypothetical protein